MLTADNNIDDQVLLLTWVYHHSYFQQNIIVKCFDENFYILIILQNITNIYIYIYIYAKQKHLGCIKGEANQKQQLSDYRCIRT